jgi:hypothetical protein
VALRRAGAGIGQYREGLHHAYVDSQQKIHEWTSFLHLVNQYFSNAIALTMATCDRFTSLYRSYKSTKWKTVLNHIYNLDELISTPFETDAESEAQFDFSWHSRLLGPTMTNRTDRHVVDICFYLKPNQLPKRPIVLEISPASPFRGFHGELGFDEKRSDHIRYSASASLVA